LIDLKRSDLNDPDAKLEAWDVSYYANIQKERFYKVDEEKIKEYFPTTKIIEVTMEIYQELLGLEFSEIKNV
jgi:Zn-dependent oligopeptidase